MTDKVILQIEAFAKQLGHDLATDAEKGAAWLLNETKDIIAAIAADPAAMQALQTGVSVVVDTAIGAAEGGGTGAIAGAVKGALPAVLAQAKIPVESAAAAFVKAQVLQRVETATAATPTHPNP